MMGINASNLDDTGVHCKHKVDPNDRRVYTLRKSHSDAKAYILAGLAEHSGTNGAHHAPHPL
eukprot:3023155-Karenia_brevis.AAC.1